MPTARDKERAAKLAKKPTKSAFTKDDEDKAAAKARAKRDESVNNERTRTENPDRTTHLPTGDNTREDIMFDLTQRKARRKG